MNTLIIKQASDNKQRLSAEFNGVIIPFMWEIKIESLPGSLTKITLEIIVASDKNNRVIIEGIENKLYEF